MARERKPRAMRPSAPDVASRLTLEADPHTRGCSEMSAIAREYQLFDYGSLLPGERDHDLLSTAVHLGPARTLPEYYLVELNAFPALVHGGRMEVRGELYRIDTPTLQRIDARKEHPVLFQRQTITLANG